MSNKIDSSIGAAGAPAPVRPVARNRDGGSSLACRRESGDSVLLTGEGQALQALEGRVRGHSGVDTAKVSEIRRSLVEGRYAPDPAAIAAGLIGVERDLQ